MRSVSALWFYVTLLVIIGCDFEYRSSLTCSSPGDCFSGEVCRFDENGVGECDSASEPRTELDGTADAETSTDAEGRNDRQVVTDVMVEMSDMVQTSETVDLGTALSDAALSMTFVDSGRTSMQDTQQPIDDIVCPSADSLVSARFECSYAEMMQRRNYCDYFVSQFGVRNSCNDFCESIGLLTCVNPGECCWNNLTESDCSLNEEQTLLCTQPYDSMICRCFEMAP